MTTVPPGRHTDDGSGPGWVVSTVSVIVDLPLAMPHLPERGGDVLGTAAPATPGGGFNVVAAAARQGVPTALLSPLGAGPNGALSAAALATEHVTVLLDPVPGDTGLCVTVTEPDGERTFLTAPGVEAHLTGERLTTAQLTAGRPAPGDVVVVSGYDLAYPGGADLAAWVAALRPGIQVLLDPGPLVGEIDAEVLDAVVRRCDLLTLNEREAAILGGAADVAELADGADGRGTAAVRALLRPGATLIARRGAGGCEVWAEDEQLDGVTVPTLPVDAVDTTGAGDSHTGVLAAELTRGTPLLIAVRRANAAGAVTATRRGPATCPTGAELDALLAAGSAATP